MTDPKVISTPDAPAAIGPYSQAKVANGFVFTAGQVPIDPSTNTLIEGDFGEQVLLVLKNINAILKAAGTDAGRAVKFTVFLKDFSNYAVLNEVFTEFFSGSEPPARSALQVSKLPLDAEVEIECIAAL